MLPVPPRKEPPDDDRPAGQDDDVPVVIARPSRAHFQARAAIALPLISWLSQCMLAANVVRLPAEGALLAAVGQAVLILFGLMFGVSALANRRWGERGVLVPAIFGIVLSAGTLLLILVMVYALM